MKKILSIVGPIAAITLVAILLWAKVPSAVPSYGAITSPEISENHISVNGVTTWTLRQNIRTATTTLCSFPNPAGTATSTDANGVTVVTTGLATSTLEKLSIQITTGTSTAATFDVATSSTSYATSTPAFLYGVSVPANTLYTGSYNISTKGMATSSDTRLTSSMVDGQNIVGPTQYVNVQTAGAGVGGYTYQGQCIATFRSVNAF